MLPQTLKLSAAAKMLRKCAGLEMGRAYLLTIGRETYPAIRYSQTRPLLQGSPAYNAKALADTVQAFYVLADKLPACYRRNPGGLYTPGLRFAFNVEPEASGASAAEGLWYVASYSSEESVKLGGLPHFLLFRETQPTSEGRIAFGKIRSL